MIDYFTKTAKQRIVDLLNLKNGTTLKVESVTFGMPQPFPTGNKVCLVLTSVPGLGYIGDVSVLYLRVAIAEAIGERSKIFLNNNYTYVADLIEVLNAAYRLNLNEDDYYNDALPVFVPNGTDEFLPFTLRIKPEALLFTDTVELMLQQNSVVLEDYITNTVLDDDIF